MHKATFMEGTLRFTIQPEGPLLIKAGETGGADPTLPDMEFVRTWRSSDKQVYIPGPSLKGVVRAQCERICRSLDGPARYDQALERAQQYGDTFVPPLADNPVLQDKDYEEYTRNGNDLQFSSNIYFNRNRTNDTAEIYRRSSFVSQMFGHTSLAGRVRFADAYSDDQPHLEERNGVAIDRIYGSVAVGPFNYETAVSGTFRTRIDFKNVTLAQLGLLGLALRDLAAGRVALGFGKSRGLGRVSVTFEHLSLRYPACERVDDQIRSINRRVVVSADQLAGLGAFCQDDTYNAYGLPKHDTAPLPEGLTYKDDEFMVVRLEAQGDEQVCAVWRACMPAWKQVLGL